MPRKTQASRVPREDIDDDNFGNSIHYRMKSERKTQAMPWQTTSTYGAEDRPTTLSFAQMMPESADRTGLHTVFGSEDAVSETERGNSITARGASLAAPKITVRRNSGNIKNSAKERRPQA